MRISDTGNTVGGAPESGIVGACAVQLADYYGLNSNVYGAGTNAVVADPQLGLEKAMNIIIPALVGSNWLSGAGAVADAASVSYEQLVIDNEYLIIFFISLGHWKMIMRIMGFSVIKKSNRGKRRFYY
jgi:trimethylamine:corrinoid methyltransferase-like protein